MAEQDEGWGEDPVDSGETDIKTMVENNIVEGENLIDSNPKAAIESFKNALELAGDLYAD